jgi:hypothetical protein
VADTVLIEGHFLAKLLHVVCRTPCADLGLKVSVVHKVTSPQWLSRHGTSIVVLKDPFHNGAPFKGESCPGHDRVSHQILRDGANEFLWDILNDRVGAGHDYFVLLLCLVCVGLLRRRREIGLFAQRRKVREKTRVSGSDLEKEFMLGPIKIRGPGEVPAKSESSDFRMVKYESSVL